MMLDERKAISPVISTVILAGVVLAVGGAVWSYSLGASTVIANGYVNDTLDLVNDVTERFMVEHTYYNGVTDQLSIWVFNYGDHKIVVDAYVEVSGRAMTSSLGTVIESEEVGVITVDYSSDPLQTLDEVAIKIHSRRQNNAYETYYVP